MKLKIELEMDNAAFDEGMRRYEAASILRDLADKIERRDIDDTFVCHDSNGNTVLHAEVTE